MLIVRYLPSLIVYFTIYVALAYVQVVAAATESKTQGGLHVIDDPCCAFSFRALAQFDDAWYSGSAYDKQGQFPSGATIQRIYLYFNGKFAKDWSFIFTPCTETGNFYPIVNDLTLVIGEAHVDYNGFTNTRIQFGHVPIPSSLENWTDYNDDLFMAVSLPVGAFFPIFDYGLGIYADRTFADTFLLQAVFFQPPSYIFFNGQVGLGKSDRLNAALRLTAAPKHQETYTIHFGAWVRYQSYYYSFLGAPVPLGLAFGGCNNTPEMDGRTTGTLVNTGPLRNKSSSLAGIEFGQVYGPWLIQAEYMGAGIRQILSNTDPGIPINNNLWFYGWYIQGGYVLTGESHPYDFASGFFHHPSPKCWYGAFEIVARYSTLNLTNKNIFGGQEYNISLGLNWYVNSIVSACANYVHARAHPALQNSSPNNQGKRKLDIFGIRVQLDF